MAPRKKSDPPPAKPSPVFVPFDPEMFCPKCWRESPDLMYCASEARGELVVLQMPSGSVPVCKGNLPGLEHLHAVCRRCHHDWYMHIAPTPVPIRRPSTLEET